VWYPGQEGGTALAQILFGEYSPSGKLPVSFERRLEDSATHKSYRPEPGSKSVEYAERLFLGYRHFDRSSAAKPLFPFGYGLSYTSFQYSDLNVSHVAKDVRVSFTVKNTGIRHGAEVAQVYVADTHSHVPRPVKELKGFAKVDLEPGEARSITIELDKRAFAYYDMTDKRWKVEPGQFTILVGSSSEKIELRGNTSFTADVNQ